MIPSPARARPFAPHEAAAAFAGAVVLDARDRDAFARGHLPNAARMSAAEFASRRAELPPREARIAVVHDDPAQAHAAAEALLAHGYRDVQWLEAPLAALPDAAASLEPAARMWRPSPWLTAVLDALPKGRALDLACGSSREGVFLALHGWSVEGWDHDPVALGRASEFAARQGARLTTRVVDLELDVRPEPEAPFDVVLVFRFLHRPLLPWLRTLVAPGGAIVYETFRQGQERFGHPKSARFLLQPGELAAAFAPWPIERSEDSAPPEGPWMSRVLARRPH